MAKAQLYPFKGNDPDAPIECCPLKATRAIDEACWGKLLDIIIIHQGTAHSRVVPRRSAPATDAEALPYQK
jgi:hypothetical protein